MVRQEKCFFVMNMATPNVHASSSWCTWLTAEWPACYCNPMDVASGLDSLLEPLSRCLDAESARRIVDLQIDAPVQQYIDALAERANDGTLSDSERSEYEALINAADFISILKLKARHQLDSAIQ